MRASRVCHRKTPSTSNYLPMIDDKTRPPSTRSDGFFTFVVTSEEMALKRPHADLARTNAGATWRLNHPAGRSKTST